MTRNKLHNKLLIVYNDVELMCWLESFLFEMARGLTLCVKLNIEASLDLLLPLRGSFIMLLKDNPNMFKTTLTFVSLLLVPQASPSLIHMPVKVLFTISHSCQILLGTDKRLLL